MDRIKVLTLNLWGEQPPLERRMALAVEWLRTYQPDLIALQEVRQTPSVPNQAATLAAALGMQYHFAVATPWGDGEEGLAILSRLPIVGRGDVELPHATEKERRILLWATVETPHGPLSAFTTHLNYRQTHGQIREDQIVRLEEVVAGDPSPLPKLLMGDFNATPDADEIRYLRGRRSVNNKRVYYQDAFALIRPGEPGYTWAAANPFTARMRWLERDRRIDYIFVSSPNLDGRGMVLDARVALDAPDPEGILPSDHYAVYAEVLIVPDEA
jgi:endonuclease/exonuclease/phosphatase family metal-dependent hydrolase